MGSLSTSLNSADPLLCESHSDFPVSGKGSYKVPPSIVGVHWTSANCEGRAPIPHALQHRPP